MFGIGSGELVLVAVVAIIVLGPETCIKYARQAGLMLRKIQTEWAFAKRHFGTMEPEQFVQKIMKPSQGTVKAADPVAQHTEPKTPPAE